MKGMENGAKSKIIERIPWQPLKFSSSSQPGIFFLLVCLLILSASEACAKLINLKLNVPYHFQLVVDGNLNRSLNTRPKYEVADNTLSFVRLFAIHIVVLE